MKLYRFSPINSQDELWQAVAYVHAACHQLCYQSFGRYLPTAGNVGIFCHYPEEYVQLTAVRQRLTDASVHFNQKYFRLWEPIVIEPSGDIPGASYSYLYIRQPDPYRSQVGDVDFCLDEAEYRELKQAMKDGKQVIGARLLDRSDIGIELLDPDIDALSYVVVGTMDEVIKQNKAD
jgi:hypothetical protein